MLGRTPTRWWRVWLANVPRDPYEPTSNRGELRELDEEPGTGTPSLDAMQAVVGGNLEAVALPGADGLVAIMNEEGLLLGLPANRCAAERFGWVGTFFIAREQGEDYVFLTDRDVTWARATFDLRLDA